MNAISDAQLDAWENGSSAGDRNAAPYLRPLTPEQRALAFQEARARMGVSPGYNYSGAVWQAAQDVAAGRTPALDRNRELMATAPTSSTAPTTSLPVWT